MNPLVCAVCLTADRPQMLARAVECFRAQTYPNKRLLVFDSGKEPGFDGEHAPDDVLLQLGNAGQTVGALRNAANEKARFWIEPDIIVHWDDDDISHPNRISEQVALLQSTGADAVGYSDCLFWANTGMRRDSIEVTRCGLFDGPTAPPPSQFREYLYGAVERIGEAWLYRAAKRNYVVGTSLCYWRRAWERRPFPDTSYGEDTEWQRELRVHAVSSVDFRDYNRGLFPMFTQNNPMGQPRIIATIHGGNVGMANTYSTLLTGHSEQFVRSPQWDEYCRRAAMIQEVAV